MAKLALSLSLTLSPNRLKQGYKKVRSLHALHHSPPPHPFSLSLLFLPFVFRGSCCNSADHQQLPFQQHLTLPNPCPSLHPDIANASPRCPCSVTPRGRPSQRPPPLPRLRHVHSYTLSNSSASLLSLCFVAHIVVPVCHHMANGYQHKRGEGKTRKWASERKR